MGSVSSIQHTLGKGLYSSTGTPYQTFNLWRANVSMPIPDNGSELWTVQNQTSTFDLNGFAPGLSVCVIDNRVFFDGPIDGTVYITIQWKDPYGTAYHSSQSSYYINIASGESIGWVIWSTNNCSEDRIKDSGIHSFTTTVSGAVSASKISYMDFLNVPDTTPLSSGSEGHIWVEGNYLSIVNVMGYKHNILGNTTGNTGNTPGHIWLSKNSSDGTDGYICYIDSSGEKRVLPWIIKQFASTGSDSATSSEFAGTDKAGYMWMDSEYGLTHAAYIHNDGYKYIFGAGNYPYL